MEKNTKKIKAFMLDAKAIWAAIMTLILITVAAAGAEIPPQEIAQDPMSPNMTVKGTLNITGSTTILPVTEAAKVEFIKLYPRVVINRSGGGSDYGRMVVYTTGKKKRYIGASSSIWPDSDQLFNGTLVPRRSISIIQERDKNATIFETKFGTGMIVIAANLGRNITSINIVKRTLMKANHQFPSKAKK